MNNSADLTTKDMSEFAACVRRVLRQIRINKGLTQAAVAARTNGLITKASLANYETGHRSLRVSVMWVWCQALEVRLEDVTTEAQRLFETRGSRQDGSQNGPLIFPVWFASQINHELVRRINNIIGQVPGIGRRADGARVLNSDQASALADLLGVPLEELRKSVQAITN